MPDFTELPVYEGVGDWHFNRFRIAFEAPASATPVALFSNLINNFPTYINSNYATAKWGERWYGSRKTIHFHGYAKYLGFHTRYGSWGGVDVGEPHTDWVAIMRDNAVSFTVQTLKREFFDAKEDTEVFAMSLAGSGTFVGPTLSAVAGATVAPHYNRMHFLAGRRAWRIDKGSFFGLSNDVMVLETVAVERLSAYAFGIADVVIGLEKRVPDIWLTFLNNFVKQRGLTPVDQTPKPGWKLENRAMHVELSFDDQANLMGDPEFNDAAKLYLDLLP